MKYLFVLLLALGVYSIVMLSGCEEECRFDNSSLWTPQDHGVYNCIGDCGAGLSCNLFVKAPGGTFVSTGLTQIPRPRQMETPTDDPNEYKCECE